MKTVTYDEFLTWGPWWLEKPEGRRRLLYYMQKRERWSALDILVLNHVPAENRLFAVLREELIDAPILHEFACRCAEMALAFLPEPDPRSVAAIEAKRKWLRGEITDDELVSAQNAARAVAIRTLLLRTGNIERDTAMASASAAALAAANEDAQYASARAAWETTTWNAAWDAIWEKQVAMLKQLLEATKCEDKRMSL